MRQKFEELGEILDEFVSQTEYPALVVECGADDVAYVAMQLQALEQTHPEAWALVFSTRFSSADEYVDGVVELLQQQLDAAGPFRQERGEPPLLPMPEGLRDRSRAPTERLHAVLEYLRSLLPNEEEYVLAVGFLPAECRDYAAYSALVVAALSDAAAGPATAGLRLVVYDDTSQPVLRPWLDTAKNDTVLTYSMDFSVPALSDALARSAADSSLAVPDRMMSLLQLAMLDQTHKRYVPALEKLGVLHDYYAEERMPALQAMCLHSAGEVLLAGGQPEAAKRMLQRGIAVAMERKVLPVLLNLSVSAVDACLELRHYEDAATYAESGMMVAARTLNPHSYADLEEKKGDAELGLGKVGKALSTYRHSADVSRNNDYLSRCASSLQKRARVYEEAGMRTEKRQAEAELLALEARQSR